MILQFTVEAVFPVPVGVVSWPGVALVVVGVPLVSCFGRSVGGGVGGALLLVEVFIFTFLKCGDFFFSSFSGCTAAMACLILGPASR